MTSRALGVAVACLIVGAGGGYLVGRRGHPPPRRHADPAAAGATEEAPAGGGPRRGDDASIPSGRAPDELASRRLDRARARDDDAPDETTPARAREGSESSVVGVGGGEVEALVQQVAACQQERVELMGEPVPAPNELPERLSGPTLSGAVSRALDTTKVGGAVEATDCSEYPCIIFGRLQGDEVDMEAVERAPALRPYEDDVLTMLFWASSVEDEDEAEAKGKPPETGLFALAFYDEDERAARGEAIERRIRARVMEYWNTDRPGDPD